MDKRDRKILLRLGIIVCLIALAVFAVLQRPEPNLYLTFCDIGQGDAILVSRKNKQVLIDGGSAAENKKLLACLRGQMPFWDRKIEVVVNTHPDEDHFGGLTEVLSRYRVDYFIHSGFDNSDNWQWQELKDKLFEQKVCSKILPAGEVFRIDMLEFESLSPALKNYQVERNLQTMFFDLDQNCPQPEFGLKSDNLNNNSLVLRFRFNQFKVLFTGDLEKDGEQILAWRRQLKPVEILKVGHHGAKNSTSEELLTAAEPKLAVISVGENSYGHPNEEVLKRLRDFKIKILRTDQNGTVKIISDGVKWWIE